MPCASDPNREQASSLQGCPVCEVPKQRKGQELMALFFLLFDFILIDFSCAQGDPTTCGWIRSEEQYAAWYVNQQKQRHMQVQSPFHSASGDVLGDLKQQVYEMKQMLDNVVEDLRSVKSQIGDKQDLGNKKKMQIVLDVYIAVGVLVGVVIGIVVARMMK